MVQEICLAWCAKGDRRPIPVCKMMPAPTAMSADADPEWDAFWTFDPRPDGSQPSSGPYVHDMEEIIAYAVQVAA